MLFGLSRVQTTSNCQAIESTIGPTNRPIMPCTSVPPRTPINMTGIGVVRPFATSGRNMLSSKFHRSQVDQTQTLRCSIHRNPTQYDQRQKDHRGAYLNYSEKKTKKAKQPRGGTPGKHQPAPRQ